MGKKIMTKEEYDLMWKLIDQAFEEGHGWGCDEDEVICLIPEWEDIVYYREKEKEEK